MQKLTESRNDILLVSSDVYVNCYFPAHLVAVELPCLKPELVRKSTLQRLSLHQVFPEIQYFPYHPSSIYCDITSFNSVILHIVFKYPFYPQAIFLAIDSPDIGVFKREFGENAKVWDREKVVVIPDHYIFTADERANRNVDTLRDFCIEQNIKHFYDIKDLGNFQANPDYKGVCHIALAQEGHCRPGEVLVGTDSHTCTAGAFGQFASGIGNTDAGFVLGTGKILLKVPQTIRFVLDGEIPNYILAKDLILQVIGEISMAGATYKTMEFVGTAVESSTIEDRMTLCNMVIEAGGKNGVIPADKTTYDYLKDKTTAHYEPVYSDDQARFLVEYHFDTSKLEPLVAKPHSPDNRALARECKDVKIDRVYIGSCTGGKTEDFMAAAKVLLASGKKVKVPTFLVPATQKVWMDLYTLSVPKSGGKTCSQIFEDAGCDTPASPSCGACMGGPRDTHARLNEPQVCVSTTNRNFPGRMGHKEGQIYLASPYTAAASALTGHVTDPREFLQ
ncbi:3-isopropylmalate dehydratase large subunit, chloroplastic-like [Lycium barbarum]|uniref:3-isopropylmalate dehydratase large subunit, chloroplastic-like n=1 Tax=Lycium barbarum TaxID=112863 RepID=UPI00293E775E|nr:3-isopropylmalate dehydratase large subunit, chloroplastic-like [Lycium barbarum]